MFCFKLSHLPDTLRRISYTCAILSSVRSVRLTSKNSSASSWSSCSNVSAISLLIAPSSWIRPYLNSCFWLIFAKTLGYSFTHFWIVSRLSSSSRSLGTSWSTSWPMSKFDTFWIVILALLIETDMSFGNEYNFSSPCFYYFCSWASVVSFWTCYMHCLAFLSDLLRSSTKSVAGPWFTWVWISILRLSPVAGSWKL